MHGTMRWLFLNRRALRKTGEETRKQGPAFRTATLRVLCGLLFKKENAWNHALVFLEQEGAEKDRRGDTEARAGFQNGHSPRSLRAPVQKRKCMESCAGCFRTRGR